MCCDDRLKPQKDKGRYGDGRGLNLVVTKSGTKQWVLRVMVHGRRREIGLGGYPDVSLAQARAKRENMRAQIKDGKDPLEIRRSEKAIPSFKDAALIVHEINKPTWSNKKAAAQWLSSLEAYAFPKIGNMQVNEIRPSHILSVLEPIWTEKHETANRVRQRMSKVFDWAKTKEYLAFSNPVSGIKEGLPRVKSKPKHFAAMDYNSIADFIEELKDSSQSLNVKLALEFLILTSVRSGELRFAEWSEINFKESRWEIPAARMKVKDVGDHHIPLTKRSLAILKEMKPISGRSPYIFPSSQNWRKPMSDATLTKALRRMGYTETVHGFRSTFRDWCSETKNYPNDIVEMCLAHQNPNKVEAAYKRGKLFEKRIEVMTEWAWYCDSKKN